MPSSCKRVDLWTSVWQVSLLAALYVVAGRLGLELTYYHDTATLLISPPSGLSLAALILFGRRLWPGIFIGALLVNLSLPLGWLPMTGIAIGNTLEPLVGASLLVQLTDFRPNFERPRDGAAFVLIGVLGCTTIGAMIGTLTAFLAGGLTTDFGSVWLIWWLSDLGGVLVLTPFLLLMVDGTPPWPVLLGRR